MWKHEKFNKLSKIKPSAQALLIYLYTGPQNIGLPGLYRVGKGLLSELLEWKEEDLLDKFDELYKEGLAYSSWEDRIVWLPGAIRYSKPSLRSIKNWNDPWNTLPDCEIKLRAYEDFLIVLRSYGKKFNQLFRIQCLRPMSDKNEEIYFEKTFSNKKLTHHFDRFWEIYPRKVSKSKAFSIWFSKNLDKEIENILVDISKRKDWNPNNPYIPHPTTYLNGRRWEDEHKLIHIEKIPSESILEKAMKINMDRRISGDEIR